MAIKVAYNGEVDFKVCNDVQSTVKPFLLQVNSTLWDMIPFQNNKPWHYFTPQFAHEAFSTSFGRSQNSYELC